MGVTRRMSYGGYGDRDNPTWSYYGAGTDITTSGAGSCTDFIRDIQANCVAVLPNIADLRVMGPPEGAFKTEPANVVNTCVFMNTKDGADDPLLYLYPEPQPIMAEIGLARAIDTTEICKSRGANWMAQNATIGHVLGADESVFDREVVGCLNWLEDVLGERPCTFGYPHHNHSRHLMHKLRRAGYIAARDGSMASDDYEPHKAFLHTFYTNPVWWQTWDYWQPWEIPLLPDFTISGVLFHVTSRDTADGFSMHELLYETSTNWAGPAPYLLPGYTTLIDMWKGENTWVQVFSHIEGAPNFFTAAKLGWLLDELIADGEVLIGSISDIAQYMYQFHAPTSDELYYEPLAGHTAADYGGVPWDGKKAAFTFSTEWDGKKAAFTFSTDDGRTDNINYAAACAARGVRMTAFVVQDWIGIGGYLTEADLQALHAGGACEIGVHSKSHQGDDVRPLLVRRAFSLRTTGAANKAVTVEDVVGVRTMKFYVEV